MKSRRSRPSRWNGGFAGARSALAGDGRFQQRDFVGRETKEVVDGPIDFLFGGGDLRGESLDLAGVVGEIGLPLAALLDGHVGVEGLLHLGLKAGEIEIMRVFEPAVQLPALGRREIEDAVADSGDDLVAFASSVGADSAEGGEAVASRMIDFRYRQLRDIFAPLPLCIRPLFAGATKVRIPIAPHNSATSKGPLIRRNEKGFVVRERGGSFQSE